jgi:molybdopterin/thiamine biosynthesis adenylyltransferase
VGSILVELLARLGVGHLILIDDDIVETTNLPRLLGSVRRDAMGWLTHESRPGWVRRLGRRLSSSKVRVATRAARRANPDCHVTGIIGDVADADVARRFTYADYLFLAADTFRARLVCNAIAFQYGVPGVQLGAKVRVRPADGSVCDVYSVVRPFGPDHGCLWCNNLIPPARLAEEAVSSEQRAAQRYVEDDDVAAPSVISLNAVAAAHAVNDFLMHIVGLRKTPAIDYLRFLPLTGEIEATTPRRSPGCTECGDGTRSRRARGDSRSLPTIGRPA